jgi:DNA invertase Pin-like site-specific DNA recombinase
VIGMTKDPRILDLYARVSRPSDDRQRPITGQVQDCTARLDDLNAVLGVVHTDLGKSAWNPRVSRPGWDQLMERLEKGTTGGVIVFDLARFSRRPIEGERLIAAAENGLLVLDSEGEYDLLSASGKKAFRDQLSAAAYESDRLSTRVARGKKLKAGRGEPNTSTRPFGFDVGGRTVRETEAAVLRELAARLLVGESQDAMIVDLNRRGIRTSYGKPWTRAGLRQVLTRERNYGAVVYDGKVVARLEGDPIFDEDTYGRIVALYTSRRAGHPISDTYLCSGIACCGLCGHRLSGRSRNNMAPYGDGGVRRQYWCQPRSHDGGCGRISVDQRDLDKHLEALTLAILGDPRHAAAVEAAAAAVTEQRGKLETEVDDLEHTAEQLAGRLGRGEISLRRHDAATKPLDKRLAELYATLADLDAEPVGPVAPEVVAASRTAWTKRWKDATTAERRSLVRQALRGQVLLVGPADPHDRTDVAGRVTVGEEQS